MTTDLSYTIGVDLGGTNVRAGLIQNGRIIKHTSAKIPQNKHDETVVLKCIIDTIKQVHTTPLKGIGIGVPGLVDQKSGIVHSVINIPSFREIPLRSILAEEFDTEIFINNDVNCFVLGEKFFGAGIPYQNVVGLSMGTGLGAGIISGNKLLDDANGGSGEFGEIPYRDANFEAYCSGQFFMKMLGKTGEEAFLLAQNGDAKALEIFQELGTHIGKVIHIILLTLDPQAIILGGSIAQSRRFFHESMMAEVSKFVFQNSLKNLQILYASEKNSPIFGAAKLVTMNANQPN